MSNNHRSNLLNSAYQNIFLIQNRDFWSKCPYAYNKSKDLILTFDFGLVNEVLALGGMAGYLDHLVDNQTMDKYNFETYQFFSNWHFDKEGRDIFSYKEIGFGNAFRIEIWNDITYAVRMLINLLEIKKISFQKLYVGLSDSITLELLEKVNLKAEKWNCKVSKYHNEFYFPVFRWMKERIYPSVNGIKQITRTVVERFADILFNIIYFTNNQQKNSRCIFIFPYHPTLNIIESIKEKGVYKIISPGYSFKNKGLAKQQRLPIFGSLSRYKKYAKALLARFQQSKVYKWKVQDIDIGEFLYALILKKVAYSLPYQLRTMDSIINFFKKKKLQLMITISELGVMNCQMLNYCHKNNIPTYIIINGLLANPYLDEAKSARWINAYGESVKKNYFKNMENVVCLGDPRMDGYVNDIAKRGINRSNPTIVIGAAGFNNIDLNAYLAFEFDFLNDILLVCRKLIEQNKKMHIIIKVRANGYVGQYFNFVKEYFSDMPIEVQDNIPMKEALARADLYISIYSQTLFEASVLGVPAFYYKKDTEIMYPPFDGESELVTAISAEDLEHKMNLFYEKSPIFEPFMDKFNMEKYIGPLDGGNLKRNLDFIDSLLK